MAIQEKLSPGKTSEHKPETGTNRLMFEKSPYLRQHAENPVDWYPWGPEAFGKAREEGKPIFLSIGYSTCHWCHVMAHESFEDPDVARLMNDVFVSIKVDREERPDIDGIYMAVCQMMTGAGGWPLTIVMTPDKKPFFAGTYFPKETRFGRVGMVDLVRRIQDVWNTRQGEALESADKITAALQGFSRDAAGEEPDESTLKLAYEQLADRFDERHGGFGDAPKFPTPHNLTFLLRYWKRTGHERALQMVEKTLEAMRRGGIYDQIGFGFHRYSTDDAWVVPHFEKMLYDQAQLAMAYTEGYLATGKNAYKETAQEVFTYVLRDMTASGGGFCSGEDADSEGEEGKFYVWTEEEIRQTLTPDEADLAIRVFRVKKEGNFVEEATGRRMGKNILHRAGGTDEAAGEVGMSVPDFRDRLRGIQKKLFAIRMKRVAPHKDDKILTDWNGLMIAALAKGARAFDESRYAEAARRAADFILQTMRGPDGKLLHRYRDGEAALAGNVDDYAFFTWGLIELYETTFETRYLRTALTLSDELLQRFWDDEAGGFYFTAHDSEKLLVRKKEIYDGAVPSGNSVAAYNLLRLGRITGRADVEDRAKQIGRVFSQTVRPSPLAFTQLMVAVDFWVGPSHEVIVAGDSRGKDTEAMVKTIRGEFVPNAVVILRPTEEASPDIASLADYTRHYTAMDGGATAYICTGYHCETPTRDIAKALERLKAGRP